MKTCELKKRINALKAVNTINDFEMEDCHNWFGNKCDIFEYGATSMYNMEKQLEERGHERVTTFMQDLSFAEWFDKEKVTQTVQKAIELYHDDEEWMAELVLCVNWKSWEHAARNNNQWGIFYSALYEMVRDLVYDYYEDNEEKVSYVWHYLD